MKKGIRNLASYGSDFFKRGNERSVKAKRNIFFSFLAKSLNILMGLIIVPVTMNYIDKMQYGIWLTLSSVIAWFGFFDIGFGNGLRNKLSEAIAHGKYKLARIYVSTTYAILLTISIAMLVIFLSANFFLNWSDLLNAPGYMAPELCKVAVVVIIFFCLQFVLQLITVVFSANQEPARAGFLNFLGNFLALLGTFVLIKLTDGRLLYLSLVLGLAPVLVLSVSSIWFYTHKYKSFSPSIKLVRLKFGKRLMNLGVKFFVIQIAVIILYQSSYIIISQLYDPSAVTPYSIVYKYFAVVPMLFSIILTPFWSAFTEAWVTKDISWIKRVMKKLHLVCYLLCVLILLMVVCSKFIYRFWVGEEILIPFTLTVSMAVYVMINIWNSLYSYFLNGVGKIKLQLIIAIAGSLINIPLALFLCKYFGINGVVLSTSIVSLAGAALYPIQFRKIIGFRSTGIWHA